MRNNEFLQSSPFTVARLKHEPETHVHKHDISLDGLGACPYLRPVLDVIRADAAEPLREPNRYHRPGRTRGGFEDIDAEIAEMLRRF